MFEGDGPVKSILLSTATSVWLDLARRIFLIYLLPLFPSPHSNHTGILPIPLKKKKKKKNVINVMVRAEVRGEWLAEGREGEGWFSWVRLGWEINLFCPLQFGAPSISPGWDRRNLPLVQTPKGSPWRLVTVTSALVPASLRWSLALWPCVYRYLSAALWISI